MNAPTHAEMEAALLHALIEVTGAAAREEREAAEYERVSVERLSDAEATLARAAEYRQRGDLDTEMLVLDSVETIRRSADTNARLAGMRRSAAADHRRHADVLQYMYSTCPRGGDS